MSRYIIFLLLILMPYFVVAKQEAGARSSNKYSSYKLPRTQVMPIKDDLTGGQYELYIKLPKNYSDKKKRYPVIYFTDAVYHIEILSAATEFLMDESILVGISWQTDMPVRVKAEIGEQASRYRDYSIKPSTDSKRQAKYQFGQASQHLRFITEQIIPHVENHFRTVPEQRSYFGYSLGGLFGAYTLMKQPDTFKHYILGSPSIWDNTAFLLQQAAANQTVTENARVFISYGSEEIRLGRYILEFVDQLQSQKRTQFALSPQVIGGDHGSAFPLTAVQAVSWLSNQIKKHSNAKE